MAFYGLDEILTGIIQWEENFEQFYQHLLITLENARSQQVAQFLEKQHKKLLNALETINPKDYQNTEFIKYIPADHNQPSPPIDDNITLDDLFAIILKHEDQRLKYYTHVRKELTYEKSQDLLDMLIQLKTGQVKKITNFIESSDIVL